MARSADKLYQAMKGAARKRHIKASPQHDLYRMGVRWRKTVVYRSKLLW